MTDPILVNLARLPLFVASAVLLSGCATNRSGLITPEISTRSEMGESKPNPEANLELMRRSNALHSYLVGQLQYDREEVSSALRSFSEASELEQSPVPELHQRLAELSARAGDFRSALREAEQALQLSPQDIVSRLIKAGSLEVLGRSREAFRVYEELALAEPKRVESAVMAAALLSSEGENLAGAILMQRHLAAVKESVFPLYFLGVLQERGGQYGEASKSFERAASLHAKNSTVYLDCIRAAVRNRDLNRARQLALKLDDRTNSRGDLASISALFSAKNASEQQLIEQLAFIAPVPQTVSDVRYRLAVALVEQQQFVEGLRELSFVLGTQPDNADARYYRASILAGSGRRREAIADLVLIQPSSPMFVKSRTLAAFIARQLDDSAVAEKLILEAREVEPQNQNLISYLVLIYRDTGRSTAAERLLRSELERAPDNERFRLQRALVLDDLNRHEDAIAEMEEVLRRNPQNAEALNFIAYSLASFPTPSTEQLTRAHSLILSALAVSPENGLFEDTLGWVLYKQGEYAEAVKHLRSAVERSGGDIEVREHLAEALVKVGDLVAAREVLQDAVDAAREQESSGNARTAQSDRETRERLEKRLSELKGSAP